MYLWTSKRCSSLSSEASHRDDSVQVELIRLIVVVGIMKPEPLSRPPRFFSFFRFNMKCTASTSKCTHSQGDEKIKVNFFDCPSLASCFHFSFRKYMLACWRSPVTRRYRGGKEKKKNCRKFNHFTIKLYNNWKFFGSTFFFCCSKSQAHKLSTIDATTQLIAVRRVRNKSLRVLFFALYGALNFESWKMLLNIADDKQSKCAAAVAENL